MTVPLFLQARKESVQELHQIILDIEDKVDLEVPQESMQRIELFEPEEEIGKYIGLGLNAEYDAKSSSPHEIWCWLEGAEVQVSLLILQTQCNQCISVWPFSYLFHDRDG